jgi:hypothetical protein
VNLNIQNIPKLKRPKKPAPPTIPNISLNSFAATPIGAGNINHSLPVK